MRVSIFILGIAVAVLGLLAGAKIYRHHAFCTPVFDRNYVYMPARGTRVGRVFLIPGMEGSAVNFLTSAVSRKWANGLAQMGADVIVLNTPIPRPCWLSDGGIRYRKDFLSELADIKADATLHHGAEKRILIAGVSYGGLHVMEAYAASPSTYIAWEAAMPVTKISALDELKNVGEVEAFDPFREAETLRGSPGYITWGERDMRVNYHLIEQLYRLIASPRTLAKNYPDLGHQTTQTTVDDLLNDARTRLFNSSP